MQALLDAVARMPVPEHAERVFHGRGGLFPGCEHLLLDWFAPVWLLTSFRDLDETSLMQVHEALARRWHALGRSDALNWVYQCRDQGSACTRLMAGQVPEPHVVQERGSLYRVHLLRGQNHGLFLDMAKGRDWIRLNARGCKVLNLFAYTCSFSVVALQAGAAEVVNLDMSAGALAIGQHNHRLNGLNTGARFLAHDLFKTWGKLRQRGPFDLVVVDPPSYQKGSFVAHKDYARVLRRLPEFLAQGGRLLLCLNAPEIPARFLLDLVAVEAPGLQFVERLDNPPVFADIDPDRALKVMLFAADGAMTTTGKP